MSTKKINGVRAEQVNYMSKSSYVTDPDEGKSNWPRITFYALMTGVIAMALYFAWTSDSPYPKQAPEGTQELKLSPRGSDPVDPVDLNEEFGPPEPLSDNHWGGSFNQYRWSVEDEAMIFCPEVDHCIGMADTQKEMAKRMYESRVCGVERADI